MTSSHRNIKEDVEDDEDDVDELDDVLDQFDPSSSSSAASKPAATQPSSAGTSISAATPAPQPEGTGGVEGDPEEDGLPSDFDDILSQQFAKELAKGMEDMFGAGVGAGGGSGAAAAEEHAGASDEEVMKQFEKIMQEMGLGEEGMPSHGDARRTSDGTTRNVPTTGPTTASSSSSNDPANFQDAIKSTMSRLRQSQSSSGAGPGSKGSGGGADPFSDFSDEDMAKLLQGLGGEGGLPEGEEGMAGMLEKMMSELMSKEVLYEPLKELRDKYPPYFACPPTSPEPSEDDLRRYHAQHDCVSQVVRLFEHPDYDGGSERKKKELRDRVGELMNQMQESGSPPPEVVGDMPAELENLPGFGGGGGGGGQPGDEECVVM